MLSKAANHNSYSIDLSSPSRLTVLLGNTAGSPGHLISGSARSQRTGVMLNNELLQVRLLRI
jgi:hypothetical protein